MTCRRYPLRVAYGSLGRSERRIVRMRYSDTYLLAGQRLLAPRGLQLRQLFQQELRVDGRYVTEREPPDDGQLQFGHSALYGVLVQYARGLVTQFAVPQALKRRREQKKSDGHAPDACEPSAVSSYTPCRKYRILQGTYRNEIVSTRIVSPRVVSLLILHAVIGLVY